MEETSMADAKVVIVTGAAGNVGVALTRLLAARNVRVAALDRSVEELASRLGPQGNGLHLPVGDLSDPVQARAAIDTAAQQLGRLDGVAATVGGFAMASVAESTRELWEQMLRVNTLTTAIVFAAALPHLRTMGGGSLVAIAAGAALRASGGIAAYAASKSAVLRLVESLADEAKGDRIRVNAVLPGTIDTPQNRTAMPDTDPARWVTPAQVAEAIAFLLSDAASGVTGAALPVTGFG
jgi:NAD(P)-dependent dehydrogenase (short-subunit alcohol dehydrogenase family)